MAWAPEPGGRPEVGRGDSPCAGKPNVCDLATTTARKPGADCRLAWGRTGGPEDSILSGTGQARPTP